MLSASTQTGSSNLKGPAMTATKIVYPSLYDQRIQLVAHALEQNSKLNEKAAAELAVHVLYAIDHIPEKVR
jgi:uncharacterized protein DUF6307